MRNFSRALLIALAVSAFTGAGLADDEASNVAHVVAAPYGRCYAKSVPNHIYDPADGPRQQGRTMVYRVGDAEDVLVQTFDWFSQRLFVRCGPVDDIVVVRLGPWHRGHGPHVDHLAIAFYRGGNLLKRYSTLDISGDEKAQSGGPSIYKNVSASVSHYTVFDSGPEMVKITTARGAVFEDSWVIRAKTVDGRLLTFDMATGDLR
jgi:hypothetical protein